MEKTIIEAESIIAEQVKIINEYVVYFALMKKSVEKYNNNVKLTEDQEKQMLENLSRTTIILSAFKKQN